jgi:predicted nuclease of predicted toxin-antitoxin system
MKFLCDMGVSHRVATWLAHAGHDTVHLAALGLQRLPNGDIFHLASTEGRIVLTFDLDFGEILAGCSGRIVSVILFRLVNTTSEFVIARLSTVLSQSADELMKGSIIVVEDGRHRVRKLPIGS